jgi:hypothetical protein
VVGSSVARCGPEMPQTGSSLAISGIDPPTKIRACIRTPAGIGTGLAHVDREPRELSLPNRVG